MFNRLQVRTLRPQDLGYSCNGCDATALGSAPTIERDELTVVTIAETETRLCRSCRATLVAKLAAQIAAEVHVARLQTK